MEVQVETPGSCQAVVSFTVPADEFAKQVQRGLKSVARKTTMKGFRPGKTPLAAVEKQYGAQVRHETAQYFFNEALNQAAREHGFVPAAQPKIEHEDLHAEDGKDFERKFELQLRPKVELGEYKGLIATSATVAVDDEELERTLEDLRMQNAKTEPAGEAGLVEGGMAVCKVVLEVGDETILDRDGLRLSVEHPVAGADADAWRDAMTGQTDGGSFEVPVTFPEDFEKEDVRGKSGTCKVEVQQAFGVTPATDEDLMRLVEAEDMDGLRTKLRERILEMKEGQERGRIETELLERVIEAHPLELPENLIEGEAQRQMEASRTELESQGLTKEEIDAQVESQHASAYEATARSMRAVYLMEAIAEKEELLVTREDMIGELTQIAQRNGASLEDVSKYYQEQNLLNQLGLEILERKVRTFLRENAEIG